MTDPKNYGTVSSDIHRPLQNVGARIKIGWKITRLPQGSSAIQSTPIQRFEVRLSSVCNEAWLGVTGAGSDPRES